ncbi:hypothetical protein SK128_000418 [Halocaridina rubra]|uniref:Galactosylgalactosylxylosylprotein 3-beta-glucuronosyltransferase n=1 Tax=Halocaridina rubra TaxID=373956 RepID=A0AAN9ADW9_HALRR
MVIVNRCQISISTSCPREWSDNMKLCIPKKGTVVDDVMWSVLPPMPKKFHDPKYKAKPKGVANRNGGIDWIRNHATEGVFYMADDDNTYDIRLFDEIRKTKTVSFFPVGLTTSYGLSTPILKDGKFSGWYDGWIANREYPVDMAGFAVAVPFLLTRPKAVMPYSAGYEETGFLVSLNISKGDLEFLADNCTKVSYNND